MQLARWFRWAVGLLVLSFGVFALPSNLEGPVLIRISSEHAIAVLDAVAIILLFIASALLYGGVWGARVRLREAIQGRPAVSLSVGFVGGLGLGLLLASVYSGFLGWWAVGAALFTAAVLAAGVHAGRVDGSPDQRIN